MPPNISMSDGNLLHQLFDEKSQTIHVAVCDWTYNVSASLFSERPWVLFQWEGVTTTRSRQKLAVTGEFIIADDHIRKDWSGHPFEAGEVRLIESKDSQTDTFISMQMRIDEKSCEEIWKVFVLGLSCPDSGGVAIRVKVKSLTSNDWKKIQEVDRYKKQECLLAVRDLSVYSGGSLKLPGTPS